MSKKTERGILIIIGLVLNPYELDFYQFGSYADAHALSLYLNHSHDRIWRDFDSENLHKVQNTGGLVNTFILTKLHGFEFCEFEFDRHPQFLLW